MSNVDFLISSLQKIMENDPCIPLKTQTPKRERQNTDFPESKASFVVYVVKKRLKGNVGQSRCSLHNLSIYAMKPVTRKKLVYLVSVIFKFFFGCVVVSERNEITENKHMTFFSRKCSQLTCVIL